MKYLILLNRKFPYKSGEVFLENEVDEIGAHFNHIFIYPSDVCTTDEQTRKINSSNVDVRILENESLRKRKIDYLTKSLLRFSKSDESNLVRKGVDSYFSEAVDKQASKIAADLEKISFNKEDEVYLYSYWLYVNAGVVCKLKEYFTKKGLKVHAFSRAHRFDIYEEKREFGFLPKREYLLEHLDCVYACSDNGATYIQGRYPLFKSKIKTSYLGTYDHGIGECSSRDVLHIVSCSRLSSVKRVHLIIEALSFLENSGIHVTWTHLGGGELLSELKKMAKQKLSWMEFRMDGAIPNTAVYDYYLNNGVDLFINVSSSEGLPVSIMEATSFGIPVIATDVGGTSEIVINKKTGDLLEEDFRPEQLAELIIKYAQMSDEEYQSLRKSTREFWEQIYQAPINYKKFAEDILAL